MSILTKIRPFTRGWRAFLLGGFLAVLAMLAIQLRAQAPGPAAVPQNAVLSRLVLTSLVTVDNANRTGNYSVLRALGSPEFQSSNTEAQLAASFRGLRESRIDVGRAILYQPTYYIQPHINGDGMLRLRGGFEFPPRSLRFDMLFKQHETGGWKIHGISVAEMDSTAPR